MAAAWSVTVGTAALAEATILLPGCGKNDQPRLALVAPRLAEQGPSPPHVLPPTRLPGGNFGWS